MHSAKVKIKKTGVCVKNEKYYIISTICDFYHPCFSTVLLLLYQIFQQHGVEVLIHVEMQP
jgi:hypothetical protein